MSTVWNWRNKICHRGAKLDLIVMLQEVSKAFNEHQQARTQEGTITRRNAARIHAQNGWTKL
ncbi:unnamed protein product [Ilex paraguariensis]